MTPAEEKAERDKLLLSIAGTKTDTPVDAVEGGTSFRPPDEPRVEGRTIIFDATQI